MISRLGLLAISATALFSWPVCAELRGVSSHSTKMSAEPSNAGIHSVSKSMQYLISSFPSIKTVAYTHLPDTIWRPLYIGTVSSPKGVVADPLNARLYVADTDLGKIFWYNLLIESDGLLKTDGQQHVAVDGVNAHWLAVNGVGDLYFTGQMTVTAPSSSYDAVYRMDQEKIASGDALNPTEVYTRSNSGYPNPRVWMPSGVAVDTFNVYWGNEEQGTNNGAVCSGTRQNIGVTSALEINVLNRAVSEVRGMAIAGQAIFFISPEGIYGADKSAWSVAVTDAATGLIQSAPGSDGWDPVSIAFDGEGTMYYTETKAGIIYQFPSQDTNPHPTKKYIDAPQVYGVTVYSMTGDSKPKAMAADYGQIKTSAVADDDQSGSFHLHRLSPLLAVLSLGALLGSMSQ